MSDLIFGVDVSAAQGMHAVVGFKDDVGTVHIVREGVSILTDHQAFALASQVYEHLGYKPGRRSGVTAFGHQIANLTLSLATLPGTGTKAAG